MNLKEWITLDNESATNQGAENLETILSGMHSLVSSIVNGCQGHKRPAGVDGGVR